MGYQSPELRGVGGWLAFFLVTLGLVTPLEAIFLLFKLSSPDIAASFGAQWPAIRLIFWGLNGAIVAIAWFITWRLIFMQRWTSVRIAVAGLCIMGILPNVIELILISLISGVPIGTLFANGGSGLFQPLIYSAIWTAYLLRSKRVANTYERYLEEPELADIFE